MHSPQTIVVADCKLLLTRRSDSDALTCRRCTIIEEEEGMKRNIHFRREGGAGCCTAFISLTLFLVLVVEAGHSLSMMIVEYRYR